MFVSLKKGEGNEESEGRFFQYYNESSVGELYKGDSRLEVVKVWVTKIISARRKTRLAKFVATKKGWFPAKLTGLFPGQNPQ